MNELKEKLTGLGLSEEMSDKAIAAVAEFAKSKIPESYHGMLDDVMAGKPQIWAVFLARSVACSDNFACPIYRELIFYKRRSRKASPFFCA
ncbi:MAG: hypothetical protein HC767_07125 [Akkermansiaceae bacterium]|nr:hypothetical protein [Akkermansiaceae bacterium]